MPKPLGPALDTEPNEVCPLAKKVVKTTSRGPLRCPDCYLENKRRLDRRRLPVKRAEDHKTMSAILASAPPSLSIEGQIARRVRHVDADELETVWNGGEGLTTVGSQRRT